MKGTCDDAGRMRVSFILKTGSVIELFNGRTNCTPAQRGEAYGGEAEAERVLTCRCLPFGSGCYSHYEEV